MSAYAQQRTAKRQERRGRPRCGQAPAQVQLRIEATEVCNQRRRQRLTRQEADQLWRQYRQERQAYLQSWSKLARAEKRQQRIAYEAAAAEWRARKAARQVVEQNRQAEDETWGQARQTLHTRRLQLNLDSSPPSQVWLAILVVVVAAVAAGLPLAGAIPAVTLAPAVIIVVIERGRLARPDLYSVQ